MPRGSTPPAGGRRRWARLTGAVSRHPIRTIAGVLALLVLAGRIALPVVVASLIEDDASSHLVGRIEVGDVDLSLLRGEIALEDVAAFGPAEDGPADADRWFHAKRIVLNLAWRPLFDHVLRLQELVLDQPFVAVTRAANGALDLRTRLRQSEKQQPAEEPPSQPWRVVLEEGAIHGGRIRYRDVTVGGAERLRLELERVETRHLTFTPSASERPGRVTVEGSVADAPFELALTLEPRAGGEFAIAGTLHAHELPLARSRVWVPTLRRFASLEGALDGDLRLVRVPGGRQTMSGRVALADLAVHTPGLSRPAVTCRSLEVVADTIDLATGRAVVRRVGLDHPTIVVRTAPALGVPMVTTATGGASRPGPAAGGAEQGAAGESGWAWTVHDVGIDAGRIVLLHGDAADTIDVSGHARDVRPAGSFPVNVTLRLPPGVIRFDGDTAIGTPRTSGHLDAETLPLPTLLAALGVPLPGLQDGTLAASLDVDTASSGLDLAGHVTVTGWRMAANDPDTFSLAWDTLDMDVAGTAMAADGAAETLHLTQLVLRRPEATLRRTDAGLVLPSGTAASDGEPPAVRTEPPAPTPVAAPPAPAPPSEGTEPAQQAGAGPELRVTVDTLRVERGTVALEDRTVHPFYRNTLHDIDAEITAFHWPGPYPERLDMTLRGVGSEPVHVTGHTEDGEFVLDAEGTKIRLAPLNPYVTSYSDYSIENGVLTFGADVELRLRRAAYDAELSLRLHDLGLGTPKAFRRDFGISLALGLALLRDVHGDIVLSVPLHGGRAGTEIGILGTLRSALHRAVLNALATPLKLVGFVFRRRGEIATFEPAPIPFHTISAALTDTARSTLEDLARALAERPSLAVALRPVVLRAERQALAEAPPPQPAHGEPPRPATPDALAAARIDAVRAELTHTLGVSPSRVAADEQPVWKTVGPPRVEVALEPKSSLGG